MPFLTELTIKPVNGDEWELTLPLEYQTLRGKRIVVEPGFQMDLASIPRIFTPLFPVHGKWTRAAVVHDWLYANEIGEREDADRIFKDAMKELGVPAWRRWMMWAAVRAGGWTYWNS